jgi:cytochrome c oxidase assembly factor CtaG
MQVKLPPAPSGVGYDAIRLLSSIKYPSENVKDVVRWLRWCSGLLVNTPRYIPTMISQHIVNTTCMTHVILALPRYWWGVEEHVKRDVELHPQQFSPFLSDPVWLQAAVLLFTFTAPSHDTTHSHSTRHHILPLLLQFMVQQPYNTCLPMLCTYTGVHCS